MDENVVEWIQGSLNRRLEAGEMFTAWDITREVREDCGSPHAILKHIVHALFANGCMGDWYMRTLCEIGGRHGPAWVYHRIQDNPEHYVTDSRIERILQS